MLKKLKSQKIELEIEIFYKKKQKTTFFWIMNHGHNSFM